MNVKEYISSGVIESYVLGMATEAERKEFEAVCASYPEVAEARDSFERGLEEQLVNDARQAPKHLKQQIEQHLTDNATEINAGEPAEEATVRPMGMWKWLAVASLLLMAGAAYWGITSNNKYREQLARNTRLQEQIDQSTATLDSLKEDARMLKQPGLRMAALKGTPQSPGSFATVYWDTAASHEVYLLINNLPQPGPDKQYQLWALMDGKPIDLGVFDMDTRNEKLLVKMQNVQNAQAFAITLEPKGGSRSPTMDSMYAMGSL